MRTQCVHTPTPDHLCCSKLTVSHRRCPGCKPEGTGQQQNESALYSLWEGSLPPGVQNKCPPPKARRRQALLMLSPNGCIWACLVCCTRVRVGLSEFSCGSGSAERGSSPAPLLQGLGRWTWDSGRTGSLCSPPLLAVCQGQSISGLALLQGCHQCLPEQKMCCFLLICQKC